MKNSINKKNLFIVTFNIIIFMIMLGIWVNYGVEKVKYIYIYILILQIFQIIRFRKSKIKFIFLIYMFSYYTPMFQYYFKNINLTNHYNNYLGFSDEKTLFIYCLFYMSIFIASYFLWDPLKVEILDLKASNLKSNNVILFYLAILFIIICILFGHKGQLEIGAYGDGNFTSTILNEYIVIFFLIAYIYSGNVKFRKYLIFISFFIYIIINFIYGDRIGVLQTSILIFILYFNNKFNYKKIVLLAIFTIMIFNAVSVFRSTGKIILKNKNEEKQVTVIDTNQSQVFNSSVSIVRLLDDNVISSYDRIESLGKYALRIVIPSKNMLLSNLSKYSTIIYASQGGGFIASYFYIWFGYLGVILVGIIVCKLFSLISKDIKNNSIVALIIFISIFPRWLVYDPLIGLKMPIYTIIIYNCFIFLNYFIKKFSI